jgi:hypothetical protein
LDLAGKNGIKTVYDLQSIYRYGAHWITTTKISAFFKEFSLGGGGGGEKQEKKAERKT